MNEIMGNLAFKEAPRTELIDGKVVMLAAPSSAHEYVAENIHGIFRDYLRGKPCRAFMSNMAVFLDSGNQYQPDVKVVCDRSKIKGDGIHGAPDLVVEVLSHSTGRYDRGKKMQACERCGVREYWIVDPESRNIEQYILQNGKFVLRDVYGQFKDFELNRMTEEERAAVVKEFRCSLFEDLVIAVEDVFDELEDW